MCLKNLIINTSKIKKRDIFVYITNTFFILTFYFLFFNDSELIYPILLSIYIFIIYFLIEISAYKKEIDKLNDAAKSPNYLCNYDNPKEEKVLETISCLHKKYIKENYKLKQEIKDKDLLFSQWIHNMKTSISVIDLAYENSFVTSDLTYALKDIKEENVKLKKNLEECLNVLRLEEFSRDYITQSINLYKTIQTIINDKKRDFIYRKAFPKLEINKDIEIHTDEKWFKYMIEQIISNSIKYSFNDKKSNVYIKGYMENEKIVLSIKDEGIGIKNEDLPRIFDAFFTGTNGRYDRNATGIGLYMVKLISEKLDMKINVESKLNQGTEFKIQIKNNIAKM